MNIPKFFNSIAQGLNSITDSYIRFLIRALLTLVVIAATILIGYTGYSLIKGKHTKLPYSEYNIPDSSSIKSDYNKQSASKPIVSDNDKPKLNSPSPSNINPSKPITQTPVVFRKYSNNNNSSLNRDTVKQNVKYNISAPVTQSAIGDGAVVNNNFNGLRPRILNDAEKLDIISAIRQLIDRNKHWGKSPLINFNLPVSDDESISFAEQINAFLYANGYDRIMSHNVMYGGRRNGNFSVKKDSVSASSYISISIYPQSNLNQ